MRAKAIHLRVHEVVLDGLPGRQVGQVVLELDLEVVERLREAGLPGARGLVFLEEVVDLVALGRSEHVADLRDGRLLPRGLLLLAGSHLEERHVADLRLDQVVNEHHAEHPVDRHRVLEMAVREKGHQRHLPGVLGHALLAAAR